MKPKSVPPKPTVLTIGTVNGSPIKLRTGETKQVSAGTHHTARLKDLLSLYPPTSTIVFHEERPVVELMLAEPFKLSEFPHVMVKCRERFMKIFSHEVIIRMPDNNTKANAPARSFLNEMLEDTRTFLNPTQLGR